MEIRQRFMGGGKFVPDEETKKIKNTTA